LIALVSRSSGEARREGLGDRDQARAAAPVLHLGDGVREDLLDRAGGHGAEVRDQTLRDRVAGEPDEGDDDQQAGEDREHGVVGESGGPVGQVVAPELPRHALPIHM
jgi:hypothetical protein